ncbi:MAG: hypothetical protein KDC48_18725, partial [Planctomycetes bacterium]|nr:hypothetical protein [Planctomycetota bacterium]
MRLLSWLLAAGAAALLVWLVSETRATAELAGRYEVDARQARAAAAAATAELAGVRAERDELAADKLRLEGDLLDWRQQHAAMAEVVRQRTEQAQREADAAAAARAQRFAPMPEGVRLCLAALHECLRAEGFSEQRFVSARSLDEEGLHDVEMIEVSSDGLAATVLYGELMTAVLDRSTGRLELRFQGGHRLAGGERLELPEDGYPIVFEPIDGRLFEERLPYLVHAGGAYPDPETKPRDPSLVDPATRNSWLERFDRLCACAGGADRLRVQRFRGMRDGWFLDAQLIGTDEHHHVVFYANVAQLAVEVDQTSGVVSLLLQ